MFLEHLQGVGEPLLLGRGPKGTAPRLVLVYLAIDADNHGVSWSPLQELQTFVGLSRGGLYKTLRTLETDGYILRGKDQYGQRYVALTSKSGAVTTITAMKKTA